MAAAIPAALAVSPPVKIPKSPFSFTASRIPFAMVYPKPVSGTVAPAPAKLTSGSYKPTAVYATPKVTNNTKILAGVNFVLSIKICPITQIKPPTTNAFTYSTISLLFLYYFYFLLFYVNSLNNIFCFL